MGVSRTIKSGRNNMVTILTGSVPLQSHFFSIQLLSIHLFSLQIYTFVIYSPFEDNFVAADREKSFTQQWQIQDFSLEGVQH